MSGQYFYRPESRGPRELHRRPRGRGDPFDFCANVIKVEPPTGDTYRIVHKLPPQPQAKDNYWWHLDNRNKRGLALDLKSPDANKVLERLVKWADVLIVNTPHPARKRLKLSYEDVSSGILG